MADELRQQYLRVINEKDSEQHRLLMETKRLEMELKKKDDTYRARLKELKAQVDGLQSAADGTQRERQAESGQLAQLRQDREALISDVNTLRHALEKHDAHMAGTLKAAHKAQRHESRAREQMEADFTARLAASDERGTRAAQRVEELEAQIAALARRAGDGERDSSRWSAEFTRLQGACAESDAVVRELRRKLKDAVPKEVVSAEIGQLEARYTAVVSGLEREVQRLRQERHSGEERHGRMEATLAEHRRRIGELETEAQRAARNNQEAEVGFAQERLQRAQTIEDLRIEAARECAGLRAQLERAVAERAALEGDVTVLSRRLHDAENGAALAARRFADDQAALEKDFAALRQRAHDATAEIAGLQRVVGNQEALHKSLAAKLDAQREESAAEIGRLRGELEHAAGTAQRHAGSLRHGEAIMEDLRTQVATLQRDLNEERQAAVSKEQSWRQHALGLDTEARAKDDERRALLQRVEDKVREQEAQQQQAVLGLQRAHQAETLALRADVARLNEALNASEGRGQDRQHTVQTLEHSVAAKIERERKLLSDLHDAEEKVLRMELTISEKDSTIASLRRSLEVNGAALTASQAALEQANGDLDRARRSGRQLEAQTASLAQTLAARDADNADLARASQRVEQAAQHAHAELQSQVLALRERVAVVTSQLHAAETVASGLRAELAQAEARHTDEHASLQRDVLAPLHEKVEQLIAGNARLVGEARDKELKAQETARQVARLSQAADQVFALQSEVSAKERRIAAQEDDALQLREQVQALRRAAATDLDESRRAKQEIESLSRRLAHAEGAAEAAARELADTRGRESTAASDAASRQSALSALQEQLRNAESLKAIAEKAARESGALAKETAGKLEELQHAHRMLQLCFDKQQEQLELGRKMREQDLKTREAEKRRMQSGDV